MVRPNVSSRQYIIDTLPTDRYIGLIGEAFCALNIYQLQSLHLAMTPPANNGITFVSN